MPETLDRTDKILKVQNTIEYLKATPLPEARRAGIIQDVRTELPKHPDKEWSRRALDRIRIICLHQTLTDYNRSTFRGIALFAVKPGSENHLSIEGAPGIPYHYGIDEKGNIYWMNDWENVTWSVRGHNVETLNIALKGNFDGRGHKGVNRVSKEQFVALEKLLVLLLNDPSLVNVDKIRFHSHFGKPACPGNEIEQWITSHKIFSTFLV